MRTFIALEVPPAFAADTAALARQLGAVVEGRFLPRANHHLTLAFLGDLAQADVAAATEALEAACTDLPCIPLRADGLGKFGRAADATLWLGIVPSPELAQLAENLRVQLVARSLPFDDKPFKPHVTLTRRARLPRVSLPPLAFPRDDRADAVTLFKSTLDRTGAAYQPLATVRLPTT